MVVVARVNFFFLAGLRGVWTVSFFFVLLLPSFFFFRLILLPVVVVLLLLLLLHFQLLHVLVGIPTTVAVVSAMAWMWLVGSLFVVRVIGALFSPIPDCDESFNFWEASLDTAASVYKAIFLSPMHKKINRKELECG